MAAPGARSGRDNRKYGTTSVRVKDLKTCYFCGSSPLAETEIYCPSCGFPQRGTEAEKKRFVISKKLAKKDVHETESETGIGRIILFILGIANGGIAAYLIYNIGLRYALSELIVAVLYIGLGIWAGRKPFPALICGLALYGTFLLYSAVISPASIFSGIVLKIGIISSLVYGITAVKRAEVLRKKLEVQKLDLSSGPDETNDQV